MKNDLNSIAFALDCCGRAIGKTYQIAQACKNLDAVMICSNKAEADRVAHEYGIRTMSLNNEFRGMKGPYLIDNHAVAVLCHRAYDEIDMLYKKLKAYKEIYGELKIKIEDTEK